MRQRRLGVGVGAVLSAVVSAAAGSAHAQSDDFADGVIGAQWTTILDVPQALLLDESGGRLNVFANSPDTSNIDALYLSNGPTGFRMSTASDFRLELDYALNGWDDSFADVGDLLGLTFGVGRDLDGTDSAAIGIGVAKEMIGPFEVVGVATAAAFRIDDVQAEEPLNVLNPDRTGTFVIEYDTAGDDLTLSANNDTYVLEDTVQAVWQADAVYVSFGARGSGFSFFAGDAWLDGFEIVSGQVLSQLGQAGDYNSNGQVEQGDLDLVLQNWGQDTTGNTPPGWANDLPVGVVDQEELDGILQNWGATAGPVFGPRAVPEPGVAALIPVLLAAGATRRR